MSILIQFSLPFLFTGFMQAFYGAVDLYVIGQFGDASDIAAVSIGSQIIYILTSFIIGMSMGITVRLAHNIGCKDHIYAAHTLGNSLVLFSGIALFLTPIMIWQSRNLVLLMKTPADAIDASINYMQICSAGFPFVIAYNVVAAILRGLGNSKTPMYFIGIACVVNVICDFLFVGFFKMGVTGAALATVLAQCISSLCGIIYLKHYHFPFSFERKHCQWETRYIKQLITVGMPVALQNMLINVSFIVITLIANSRGITASSAVGVVEKLMSFAFLVPSSMLSAISAITAQNMGAGNKERAIRTVKYGILISAVYGLLVCICCWTFPDILTGIFTKDSSVIHAAGEYIRTYSTDCILIAFTFCLNGYLCGQDKSIVTFVHYVISIFAVRIPCAYVLSRMFPNSLLPLGLASPLGTIMSLIILTGYFRFCVLLKHGSSLLLSRPAYKNK